MNLVISELLRIPPLRHENVSDYILKGDPIISNIRLTGCLDISGQAGGNMHKMANAKMNIVLLSKSWNICFYKSIKNINSQIFQTLSLYSIHKSGMQAAMKLRFSFCFQICAKASSTPTSFLLSTLPVHHWMVGQLWTTGFSLEFSDVHPRVHHLWFLMRNMENGFLQFQRILS